VSDAASIQDHLRALGLATLGEDPSPEAREAFLRRWVQDLDGADPLRKQIERNELVKILPAGEVDAALRSRSRSESDRQGRDVGPEDPEPWPASVDPEALLDGLVRTHARFLALPSGAATAAALWVMHAHAHDASEVSPLLAITSPEKRCGKTTLLELATALVPRPMPAANVTPAVLFRAVEKYRPTLLADEMDSFIGRNDELRGILNSGHRRSLAYVLRSVGDDFEPRAFSTWCPKVVALIGKLPDTLADRSIPVRMRRKARAEKVERLRFDRLGEFEPLRRQAWTWAQANLDLLRSSDPIVPPELNDRAADNWRPLLAVADLAGGPWPERARRAAVLLSTDCTDDDSAGVLLLGDLERLFRDREADRLSSAAIISELVEMEDRPWPEWRNGKPLSKRQLARLLKPFGAAPKPLWIDDKAQRGYDRADLKDAFARYLPADPLGPQGPNNDNDLTRFEKRKEATAPYASETAENPRGLATLTDLTVSEGGADYLRDERQGMALR